GKLPFADVTLLAHHGYQKSPSYLIVPLTSQVVQVRQEYGQVNTYGLFLTRAEGAYVARLFALGQPRRNPVELRPASSPDAYDSLGRYGGGFDYVFSEDLKVYTEAFYERLDHRRQLLDPTRGERPRDDTYVVTYRAESQPLETAT